MPPVITSSSDLPTEWRTFRRYVTNQPREDIKEQLKELSTNSMMQTMFPNLSILANVCLTIPVGTATYENDKVLSEKSPWRSQSFVSTENCIGIP